MAVVAAAFRGGPTSGAWPLVSRRSASGCPPFAAPRTAPPRYRRPRRCAGRGSPIFSACRRADEIARRGGKHRDPGGTDLGDGVAREGGHRAVGRTLDLGDGLHKPAHHVPVGPTEDGDGEGAASGHQIGRQRTALEGDRNQLGLETDLYDQIGRHEVHLCTRTAPHQIEPRRERPEDPATMVVEGLLAGVGGTGVSHPKMPPDELSVVVVVETTLPSICRMRARTCE